MRQKRERFIAHARGNVLNFLDYQLPDGYIPVMIQEKDFPEPYLNRKHREGVVLNMHKPFLCQQIHLVSEASGSSGWIKARLNQVESYLECYERTYFNEACGLYVWADDVMIGMDNDPATFGRPRFSTAGMFLNGFMVAELRSAAMLAGELGNLEKGLRLPKEGRGAEKGDPGGMLGPAGRLLLLRGRGREDPAVRLVPRRVGCVLEDPPDQGPCMDWLPSPVDRHGDGRNRRRGS